MRGFRFFREGLFYLMIYTDYYLVVYDIHEQSDIAKIVKRLNQETSMRIQKSIFEVQCEKREIEKLILDINHIVNKETDKVAIIPLCSKDYDSVYFLGILSKRPSLLPKYFIL